MLDVGEIFESFFTEVMQKVFALMHPEFVFSDEYKQCIADNMEAIQPFATTPEVLAQQVCSSGCRLQYNKSESTFSSSPVGSARQLGCFDEVKRTQKVWIMRSNKLSLQYKLFYFIIRSLTGIWGSQALPPLVYKIRRSYEGDLGISCFQFCRK